LISKEHNGDYLTNEMLYDKFKYGLNSINVAPEFGQIETKTILDEIFENNDEELFDEFYKICLESKRWVKWVDNDFNPENNKKEIINICGHYVFSNPDFLKIKEKLSNNIDLKIKKNLYLKIDEMVMNSKINLSDKLNLYFNYFANKDINGLSKLFSDEIVLSDWEINESGKDNVLNANLNIFNSLKSINIILLSIYESNSKKSFAVELDIIINNNQKLNVIDIIEFDENDYIVSIKAFKK
jgi:hypothetical protein